MTKNQASRLGSCATAKAILRLKGGEISEGKTMRKVMQTEKAPKPVGAYSRAVKVSKFLFVSGQMAIDPEKGKIIADGIKAQTARVMENLKGTLQAAGYYLSDVVQSSVYLSMAMFSDFNEEYTKYFDKGFPARVTVGIELMPGALLEISVLPTKISALRDFRIKRLNVCCSNLSVG